MSWIQNVTQEKVQNIITKLYLKYGWLINMIYDIFNIIIYGLSVESYREEIIHRDIVTHIYFV